MRGIGVETQAPIEIYYRRHFSKVWISFRNVNAFRTGRDELQNNVLGFRAETASEVLDRWNGRFWADVIVVRNYTASSDLIYYPRMDVRCEAGTTGLEVSLTAYPNALPELPRELMGWTGSSPTHLNYTANQTRFSRVLEMFFAFPSPVSGAMADASVDAPDKSITLGRGGASAKPMGAPISMKKTNS